MRFNEPQAHTHRCQSEVHRTAHTESTTRYVGEPSCNEHPQQRRRMGLDRTIAYLESATELATTVQKVEGCALMMPEGRFMPNALICNQTKHKQGSAN